MNFKPILKSSIVFIITSALYGCSHSFKLQIYNNSGKDLKATWDDASDSAKPNGVLRLSVKNFDPDKFFKLQIGTEIFDYPRIHGMAGCWEFPASGGCNVWQLQPDRTIWYLGGSQPTLKPPYPTPSTGQPPGFPLKPMIREIRTSNSSPRSKVNGHFANSPTPSLAPSWIDLVPSREPNSH